MRVSNGLNTRAQLDQEDFQPLRRYQHADVDVLSVQLQRRAHDALVGFVLVVSVRNLART